MLVEHILYRERAFAVWRLLPVLVVVALHLFLLAVAAGGRAPTSRALRGRPRARPGTVAHSLPADTRIRPLFHLANVLHGLLRRRYSRLGGWHIGAIEGGSPFELDLCLLHHVQGRRDSLAILLGSETSSINAYLLLLGALVQVLAAHSTLSLGQAPIDILIDAY